MEKKIRFKDLEWIRKPPLSLVNEDSLILETAPHTTLIDNTAAEASMPCDYLSLCFTIECEFACSSAFDQCGILIYNGDSRKATYGIEYHDVELTRMLSTVFYSGGFDCSVRDIGSAIHKMFFRIWVRQDLVLLQYSFNGKEFCDFRHFHMDRDEGIRVGIYACSAMDSSFDCTFKNMTLLTNEEV